MRKNKMNKGILLLVSVSVWVSLWPAATARADEFDDLKKQLKEQTQKLQDLQQKLEQLESRQKIKEKSLSAQIEKVAEKTEEKGSAVLPDSLKWLEKIKISGDLRYRHEHTDQEAESAGRTRWLNGSDRDRIRARLMLEAMINEDWDVGFRIASGSSRSPNSTNQDLEDAFSSKELWLDLAYFNWHPAAEKRLSVFGGKMKNPFYKTGKNELIWDNDLNPEGIAVQYTMSLSDVDQVCLNGGGFWVDESTLDVDTSLWGAQAYWKHTIGNPDYVLAGMSYYDYGNLKGRTALSRTWSPASLFFGNTSTGNVYRDDYDIFEAFGEYGFKCGGLPTAIFGSWVQNIAASTNEDTGWLIGTKLNKAKEPGSWEFSYDYRELDADAVVGGFIESDFLGSATDSRGHKFGFKYQLVNNLRTCLTYYHLEDTSSSRDLDYRRLMADLVFKF
ncbi:putative porin [Planctomycetota bacterium]